MARGKIQQTKVYRMFRRSDDNRPLDMKKHRRLFDSMKQYGFIRSFPIVCHRNGSGLVVKDGQHRLAVAESLGLPVWWVEEEIDFDIAVINCTSKTWTLRDYAQKFSASGKEGYQEGLAFAELHGLPIGTAFALLHGTTSYSNVQELFERGEFKVKDRDWAELVASIYAPIVKMSRAVSSKRFIEACMAVCRVEWFDPKRLLSNCERCREKLVSYSTRDAFLTMLEDIYNFGRKQIVPLRIEAEKAMRERNAATKSSRKKGSGNS